MIGTLKTMAAAAVLAATASMASAAPANMSQVPAGVSGDVVQVHGNHRSCQRGPGGWHRHNRNGERRQCREWRGQGRRPDACVKFGPIWYCDY
jgi:Spy/CpxP family protein refolding chaperone